MISSLQFPNNMDKGKKAQSMRKEEGTKKKTTVSRDENKVRFTKATNTPPLLNRRGYQNDANPNFTIETTKN